MGSKVTTKTDTRAALINVGTELMLQKGYSNTSVHDVLSEVNLPKGCFYHYFDSKENFAVAIIHQFDAVYSAEIGNTLSKKDRTPIERLRDYCEKSKAMLVAQECSNGCLIGNLSQEMSDQSEVLRKELSGVMNKWRAMFTACIEEGQNDGAIASNRSAHDLAEFFSSGWSGAVMTAKTLRKPESLDIFMDVMFEDVLKT